MLNRVLLGVAFVAVLAVNALATVLPIPTMAREAVGVQILSHDNPTAWNFGVHPMHYVAADDQLLYMAQATITETKKDAAVVPGDSPSVSTHQDTTVDIKASWLSDFLPVVGSLLMLLITWAFRFLPGYVTGAMKLFRVDQILQKSIDMAITRVQGAIKGKVWSIDVGNAVVAAALENFLASAPASLIAWAGGKEGLVRKILARVNEWLPEEFGDINPAKVDHKGDPAVVARPATNFSGRFAPA